MATILLSGLAADVRGSVNGWTFSRNANGNYVRNKTTPTNKASEKQQTVRARMQTVINAWRSLTGVEESNYVTHATQHRVQNRVGQSVQLTAYQMFLKRNMQLLAVGQPIVTSPGPDPEFPNSVISSFTLEAAVGGESYGTATVATDVNPGNAGQTLDISITGQLSTGQTSTRQFYRQVLVTDASADKTFDISSELLALNGLPIVGSRVFVTLKVIDNATGIAHVIGATSADITQAV